MTISITGDTDSLDAFADKLSTLDSVLDKAAAATAARGKTELVGNFAAKRDPYRKRWKSRKRAAPWPLMTKSGALRGSITAASSGPEFTFSFGTFYGIYHQGGTSRMVARMVIPDQGKGIPSVWIPWMRSDFQRLMAEHLD